MNVLSRPRFFTYINVFFPYHLLSLLILPLIVTVLMPYILSSSLPDSPPRCPTLQYTIWPGLPATAGSRAGKGRPGPGGPGRPARPGGQPGYRGLREEDPPPGAGETWAEPQTARWGWPKSPPGCVCRCESRTCTLKHYNLRMRVNVDISEATVYTHRRYFTFRGDKMQKTVFF